MRNLSSNFRHDMYYNSHDYDYKAIITLADNTVLTLTNTELWTGGFSTDDAVSEDNSFTALGSTVIGAAKIIINNINQSYSDYDFTNAKVELSLSKTYTVGEGDVSETVTESIRMGRYTTDECIYNGGTITLSLLDNMEQFDRPYSSSNLMYPATLLQIVENACLRCGVQLETYTFPHSNYTINVKPNDEAITYREVLGWVATIAGCFARCNSDGKLELKWFDTNTLANLNNGLDGGVFDSATPYASGDNADGGSFNPWNTGYDYDEGIFSTRENIHYLNRLYSQTIGIDDIVITGIHIIIEENDENSNLKNKEYTFGQDGYIIKIENNKLINADNVSEIGNWLANAIVGMRFRNVSVTHVDDPSIEAGDIGIVIDRKQNEYPILITRTSYSAGGSQTTICGAESPSRNSASRFSDATKAYVDARKLLNQEQTRREQAVQALTQALAAKSGLYSTQETAQGGGTIYYLHDKPLLADSLVVWKMTTEAWGVSTDGGETWNAGMMVNGDVITRILTATGINANWINTGELLITDGDDVALSINCSTGYYILNAKDVFGNTVFHLDSFNAEVDIIANSFKLISGDTTKTIEDIADDRITNADVPGQISNAMTQQNVFNALTNNGRLQGIFMQSGELYINMSYLRTGILSIMQNNTETMYVNANTGEVRIAPTTFTLGGLTVSQIADDRITNANIPSQISTQISNAMTQQNIFNKLTNNGQTQGIALINGKLYINWEYAQGGKLKLGGQNNYLGTFIIQNFENKDTIIGDGQGFRVYDHVHTGFDHNNMQLYTDYTAYGVIVYYKSSPNATPVQVGRIQTYTPSFNSGQVYNAGASISFSDGLSIYTGSNKPTTFYDDVKFYGLSAITSASYNLVLNNDNLVRKLASSSKRYKTVYKQVTEKDIKNAYNIDVYLASYKDGYLAKNDPRNGQIYPMFIAEQMHEHLPIAVDVNNEGQIETWNERVLIPIMFQMIKDQHDTIIKQEERINDLEKRLTKLEALLE